MDEDWQRHHMTFAVDDDDEQEQVAEATQYATNILNKSFICDKTVDVTANFQQDEEDEKECSSHDDQPIDDDLAGEEQVCQE